MSDYHEMNSHPGPLWQLDEQWNFAFWVDEHSRGMLANVTFGTPELLRISFDRASVPATPIDIEIPSRGKNAVLVRKQNDVVFENDEQVRDLLADYPGVALRLVTNHIWVAPQGQKRAAGELRERSFRARRAIRWPRPNRVLDGRKIDVRALELRLVYLALPFGTTLPSHVMIQRITQRVTNFKSSSCVFLL
jgi:hypothetical protein